MSRLNPNSPETSGIEWLPTRAGVVPLKIGVGTGVQFVSSASETIASIWPRLNVPAASGQVGCDIYDAADAYETNDIVGGFELPNSTVDDTAGLQSSTDNGATWIDYVTHTADEFLGIGVFDSNTPSDIAAAAASSGAIMRYKPTLGSQKEGHVLCRGAGSYFDVKNGGGGNDPAGQRIAWVEVQVTARALFGSAPTVDGTLRIAGGTIYGSDGGPQRISPQYQRYTFQFFTNPVNGAQWTPADIARFQTSGGDSAFGFSVRGGVPTDFVFVGLQLCWRSCDEKRLATGYGQPGDTDNFVQITLLDPADHTPATWSKNSGNTYVASLFLTGRGGAMSLVTLDEANLAEMPAGVLPDWQLGTIPDTLSSAVPSARVTLTSAAPTLFLQEASTAIDPDGQPYNLVGAQPISTGAGTMSDKIVAGASAPYGIVDVVVARLNPTTGAATAPDDDLTITLDGTAVGTVAAADVPADGRFHLLTLRLGSTLALTGGSSYTVEFSSGTSDAQPWAVATVAVAANVGGTLADIQIGTDAVVAGSGDTQTNFLANMKTVPVTPADFTVTPTPTGTDNAALGSSPAVTVADLAWSATSLGGEFLQYEIQRRTVSDFGTSEDWTPVFVIQNEGTGGCTDLEVVPGTTVSYRLRVVRTDGATSDWAEIDDAFVVDPIDCGYILAANGSLVSAADNPSFLLGFQEVGDNPPTHSYSRANSGTATVVLIEGRQRPVAFRNTIEGNSDVWQLTFIAAMDVPGIPANNIDRAALDQLLVMCEDPAVDYISLSDSNERRWYVFPEFQTGPYSWQGHEMQATVKFTEVDPTPTVFA